MRVAHVCLLFCAAGILTGCGSQSSPAAPTPPTPTRVMRLGGNLSFGDVAVGQVRADGLLTITNDGNSTLTVTSVSAPCASDLTATWTNGTITAGATQTVGIRFAPTSARNCSGVITVNGDQTGGTSTIALIAAGVAPAPPPPATFARNLSGTWRGTLSVDTVVYLTHSGTSLSGEYNAVNVKGTVSGTVGSTGQVTFSVSVSGYAPFTFSGQSDAAGNTLTGTVNGSGFVNAGWTLRRQ